MIIKERNVIFILFFISFITFLLFIHFNKSTRLSTNEDFLLHLQASKPKRKLFNLQRTVFPPMSIPMNSNNFNDDKGIDN